MTQFRLDFDVIANGRNQYIARGLLDDQVLILIPHLECLFTYEIADVSGNYMFLHPGKNSLWHNIDLKINRLPHVGDKKMKGDICKAYLLFRLFVQEKKNLIQCQVIVKVKFKLERFHSSNLRQVCDNSIIQLRLFVEVGDKRIALSSVGT